MNKMKYLSLQLQPELNPTVNKEELIDFFKRIGYETEIAEDNESGQYINILIKTNDLKGLWLSLKPFFIVNKNYSDSVIVTCEGDQGWENYLLLHHFDSREKLDTL